MRLCTLLAAAVLLVTTCVVHAVRDLDRNSALIGWSEEASSERIVLSTSHGEIRIKAFHDVAPATSKLVTDLARRGGGQSLNFYRHEHAAQGWGVNGFWGPPYGLLQGSLADIDSVPPFENGIDIEKGHVCIIPNTKEFFIATVPHPEWNRAHAVWGRVDGFETVDLIPFEPSFTRTDNSNPPIVTTWLNQSIPFTISLTT